MSQVSRRTTLKNSWASKNTPNSTVLFCEGRQLGQRPTWRSILAFVHICISYITLPLHLIPQLLAGTYSRLQTRSTENNTIWKKQHDLSRPRPAILEYNSKCAWKKRKRTEWTTSWAKPLDADSIILCIECYIEIKNIKGSSQWPKITHTGCKPKHLPSEKLNNRHRRRGGHSQPRARMGIHQDTLAHDRRAIKIDGKLKLITDRTIVTHPETISRAWTKKTTGRCARCGRRAARCAGAAQSFHCRGIGSHPDEETCVCMYGRLYAAREKCSLSVSRTIWPISRGRCLKI